MSAKKSEPNTAAGCGCLLVIILVVGLIIGIGVISSGSSKSKPLGGASAAFQYLINYLPGVDPLSSATWHGLCNQDPAGWVCTSQQDGYSNDKSDRCQVLFICYRYPRRYWQMGAAGENIRRISSAQYASRAF